MTEREKRDALDEARATLAGVLDLLSETRPQAEVPVTGIHALLSCVECKLRLAAS